MKGKEETEDEREGWKEKTKAAQRGEKIQRRPLEGRRPSATAISQTPAQKTNFSFLFCLLHQKMNPFPMERYCDRHEEGVRVYVEQ